MWNETKLTITDDYIQETESKEFVMMRWETPIMQAHIDAIAPSREGAKGENGNNDEKGGGDFLEFGFGLGISADMIQKYNPSSYTIVENHPQILPLMREWAKGKENVIIIEGDWYENIDSITKSKYDAILFDTYADSNFIEFDFTSLLKDGGKYTYFNGFGPLKDIETIEVRIQAQLTHQERSVLLPYAKQFVHNPLRTPHYGITLLVHYLSNKKDPSLIRKTVPNDIYHSFEGGIVTFSYYVPALLKKV